MLKKASKSRSLSVIIARNVLTDAYRSWNKAVFVSRSARLYRDYHRERFSVSAIVFITRSASRLNLAVYPPFPSTRDDL